MLTFGSLFAGFGGLDLGLERAGMRCRWQVEIDDYCQRVLAKNFPHVAAHKRWNRIETFPPSANSDWVVDLIAGGFPCQDISNAGTKEGLAGKRSGLWHEFARVLRNLVPEYVIVENVPEVTSRGLGTILGDLATLGYDAEWACLPAAAFGAPHIRERFFLVAYSKGFTRYRRWNRRQQVRRQGKKGTERLEEFSSPADCIHAQARIFGPSREIAALPRPCWGTDQPGLDRASYGVPSRVERITGLGNAVVPAVAEWIGRRIIQAHEEAST